MSFKIEFIGNSPAEVKDELAAIAAPDVVKLVVEKALEAIDSASGVYVHIAGHIGRGGGDDATAIEVKVRPVMHNIPRRAGA
jgi:hypothetical protein